MGWSWDREYLVIFQLAADAEVGVLWQFAGCGSGVGV